MKEAGIKHPFMLLRSPMEGQIDKTIRFADISLNSEISILRKLNKFAEQQNRIHNVILMVELGDRREGILPDDLGGVINDVIKLNYLKLIGIATNLGCLNGVIPDKAKMSELTFITKRIINKYKIPLSIVSGGNSSNFQWLKQPKRYNKINHLRIGEAILLGIDPISSAPIPEFEKSTFILQAEIIESKWKNSQPAGSIGNKSGVILQRSPDKQINRAILAIGIQDIDIKGCVPINKNIEILGATSDHMIITNKKKSLKIGDIVEFHLKYQALLRLMISPYVTKNYVH